MVYFLRILQILNEAEAEYFAIVSAVSKVGHRHHHSNAMWQQGSVSQH